MPPGCGSGLGYRMGSSARWRIPETKRESRTSPGHRRPRPTLGKYRPGDPICRFQGEPWPLCQACRPGPANREHAGRTLGRRHRRPPVRRPPASPSPRRWRRPARSTRGPRGVSPWRRRRPATPPFARAACGRRCARKSRDVGSRDPRRRGQPESPPKYARVLSFTGVRTSSSTSTQRRRPVPPSTSPRSSRPRALKASAAWLPVVGTAATHDRASDAPRGLAHAFRCSPASTRRNRARPSLRREA